MLAGLISSPETYSPVNDKEAALNRRNVVISRMEKLEMITPEQAAEALAAPLGLHITEIGNEQARFPFFVEYLKSPDPERSSLRKDEERAHQDPVPGRAEHTHHSGARHAAPRRADRAKQVRDRRQGGHERDRRGRLRDRRGPGTRQRNRLPPVAGQPRDGTGRHRPPVGLGLQAVHPGRRARAAASRSGRSTRRTADRSSTARRTGRRTTRCATRATAAAAVTSDMSTATAGSINAYFVNLAIEVGPPAHRRGGAADGDRRALSTRSARSRSAWRRSRRSRWRMGSPPSRTRECTAIHSRSRRSRRRAERCSCDRTRANASRPSHATSPIESRGCSSL